MEDEMTTYVIVRYRVTDEDSYDRYRELAGPTHAPFGGTLVAKGSQIEALEGGDDLTGIVLLEFPDPDAARNWYRSGSYQAAKAARQGAGEMTLSIIEG